MTRNRTDAALIGGAALLTNFTYYFFTARDYLFPDSFTYLDPARHIRDGLGFINAAGGAETLRTPGYPLLLAAFGARIVPVIVAQHLMNAAIAVMVYLIAAKHLGRRTGVVAALLTAIDTPSIHYANKILSETLFTLVLLVVFWLLARHPERSEGSQDARRRSFAALRMTSAGLLTGVLVLIRPVAIAYFVVVAAYMFLRRMRARDVVTYAVLALVLPCGWAVRNFARTSVFTVSSISGTNLLMFRAAGTLAIIDGGDFDADLRDEGDGLLEDANAEIERALDIDDVKELPHAVLARWYTRDALRVIRAHPLAFAELTLRGLLVNLFDSRWEAMSMVSRFHPSVVQIVLDALTAALVLFAIFGALQRSDLRLLAVLTVAYFLLISAGGESESRFRVPVVPQMAMLAAAGVEAVKRAVARPPQ